MADAAKTGRTSTRTAKSSKGFSAVEQAAMRDRVKEMKAEAKGAKDRAAGEADVRAKIAEMPEPDRSMAERIHEIVATNAPTLSPRTFYGMPAYARAGKVVCFFQAASKFKVRYATFGFQHDAALDDGAMWPVSYAVTELTPEAEALIADLVRRAAR
jgi:uncharacterized protein YdhG (YjbR/CyaY superfamily)